MGNTTGKRKEFGMSKKDYDIKYQKENVRRISFALNKETDSDIIDLLEQQNNVNGFLKWLIRKYIVFVAKKGQGMPYKDFIEFDDDAWMTK